MAYSFSAWIALAEEVAERTLDREDARAAFEAGATVYGYVARLKG